MDAARQLVVATARFVTFGVSACSGDESGGAEAVDSTSTPSSWLPTTPGPGGEVTDFNGPPDIGISYTVPDGVREVPDGGGKRAYELTSGRGAILIGELEHVYALRRNGLLQPRQVGNDAAAALEVIRQRKDYEVLAQGTVPVAGAEVPLVAVRLAKGAFASDLWCFTHDTSCYKNPQGLMTQTILIPWRDSMIWVNVEWEGGGPVPPALAQARDELLRSLELAG